MNAAVLSRLRPHVLPAVLLTAVLAGMTAATWQRWGDPVIDTGRIFYVGWRLSEGDALYRDVAYQFGPLSAWISAGLLRLGGGQAGGIVTANLLVIAGLLAGLYGATVQWIGRATATLLGIVFLAVFAFAHLQRVGTYNFVLPYAQPMTHGLALCVVVGVALDRALNGSSSAVWVAHGAAGLAALTKPEFLLCVMAQLALFWLLAWPAVRPRWSSALAAAVVGVAVPAVAVVVMQPTGWRWACFTPLWPWGHLEGPVGRQFYGAVTGMAAPLRNLGQVLAVGAAQAVAIAGGVRLARWVCRTGRPRVAPTVLAAVVLSGGVALAWSRPSLWLHLPRAVPLVVGAWAAVLVWRIVRAPTVPRDAARHLLVVTAAAALLAKIALRTQIDHYGVVLALPAVLLTLVLVLHCGPRALGGAVGDWCRRAAWTAVIVVVAWHAVQSWTYYRDRTLAIGTERALLRVAEHEPRGRAAVLEALLAELRRRCASNTTLAVLPEGCGLNYALGVRSSVPYVTLTPFDLELFGAARIAAALQASPPDIVVVLARDTAEMGPRFFGVDYAPAIQQWLDTVGAPEFVAGTWPPQPGSYGAALYTLGPN